jgi:hypothetical protein
MLIRAKLQLLPRPGRQLPPISCTCMSVRMFGFSLDHSLMLNTCDTSVGVMQYILPRKYD